MKTMQVGIAGCGLIGRKRADSLPPGSLNAVADISYKRAENLAKDYPGVAVYTDWKEMLKQRDLDIVIVATTNDWLAPVTLAAVEAGKHVLVEKPAARNFRELEPVIRAAEERGVKIRVGYNLRCHPAFVKTQEILRSGILGPVLYIRGRYGHGGRPGYEKEWRANPAVAGGGELLDQGVHLIDLSRWILGDFSKAEGHIHTYFWQMPVEDNGFLYLETERGQAAWLQVSCTEWKNLFSFEIFCEKGKLQVDGIGGSYGTERLTCYRMLPQMGPPATTIWEYPFADTSWKTEFEEFIHAIATGEPVHPDLAGAYETLKVVARIYGERV